jgi:probable phosphoglycerate mutase
MARLIADRCMGGGDWRAIYVSPLARARETAQPAAEALGLTLQVEPGLREIAHGVFEGLLEEEARSQYPEAFVAYERHPGLEAPPGGESGYAVAARALPVVEKIRVEHRSGDVLIVSHKATIRVLVSALLGLDVDLYRARLAQPVGTFTTLELTPQGWLLRALADACHLDPALRRAGGI